MIHFLFKDSIPKRIAASFLSVIMIGSILLSLPIVQSATSKATYFDHLFTTVSMVCVTGLSTLPVAETYNALGQVICMLLMQIGGLGLMSIIAFFLYYSGEKMSLVDKLALQDSLNHGDSKNFRSYLSTIFKYTFFIEAVAAVILSFRFIPELGIGKGIFTTIFLSISAFCNAGFDNLGSNSFINYATDPVLMLVVATLITLGGIGFSVWFDIKNSYRGMRNAAKKKGSKSFYQRLHYHTKMVIWLSGVLLVSGTVLTLLTEWNNPNTIGSLLIWDKIFVSFFQKVT